jgi:hypothetical protein
MAGPFFSPLSCTVRRTYLIDSFISFVRPWRLEDGDLGRIMAFSLTWIEGNKKENWSLSKRPASLALCIKNVLLLVSPLVLML